MGIFRFQKLCARSSYSECLFIKSVTKQNRNGIALLSHLRWISALTVVLSHVRQGFIGKTNYIPHINSTPNLLVKQQLFGLNGYGHAAVVVFFVLSGFLVGGKLIKLLKSANLMRDWRHFLIDRFVRIFVVLWPAALLSAGICFCLVQLIPNAPFVKSGGWAYMLPAPLGDDASLNKWAAIVTLLNELVTPTVTCNGPLWSLAYEWSYYIIGLAAVLAWRACFTAGSILLIVYGVILLVLAAHNQPVILISGISWLAGVFARAASDRDILRSRISQAFGVALVIAVLLIDHKHPLPDLFLGTALAIMVAHSNWKNFNFGARLGEQLAAFSYSLYLVHFPMLLGVMGIFYALGLLPHPMRFGAESLVIAAATTVFLVLSARAFAWATEDRTSTVRRIILNLTGNPGSRPVTPLVQAHEAVAKE